MNTMEMLSHQALDPFLESEAVKEIVEAHEGENFRLSVDMFLLGYIEGKRAERARKRIKKCKEGVTA